MKVLFKVNLHLGKTINDKNNKYITLFHATKSFKTFTKSTNAMKMKMNNQAAEMHDRMALLASHSLTTDELLRLTGGDGDSGGEEIIVPDIPIYIKE